MYTSGCAIELENDLSEEDYGELFWYLQLNEDDFILEYLDFELEER